MTSQPLTPDQFFPLALAKLREIWHPLLNPPPDFDKPERLRKLVDDLTATNELIESYFANLFPDLNDSQRTCLDKYRALRSCIALAREYATKLERSEGIGERDIDDLREKVQRCQSALLDCQACLQGTVAPTLQPPPPKPFPEPENQKPTADAELRLETGAGRVTASIRFTTPDNHANIERSRISVALDVARLATVANDSDLYSCLLTDMLFAAQEIRDVWVGIQTYLQIREHALRLRICIHPDDIELHSVRWELLADPTNNYALLARDRQILFSRYLESADFKPVQLLPRNNLRVLAVAVNPRDLNRYQRAAINVKREFEQVRKSFTHSIIRYLGSIEGEARVTQAALFGALNQGCHIFYMICHGKLDETTPYLWLEDQQGNTHHFNASQLVEHIAGLPAEKRPVLVVLASCQSAGQLHAENVLAALGPQLALAGVGAVIAMQGNLTVETADRLMPILFEALLKHNEIDRALAIARSELASDQEWWMPVLFLRLRDGRLWSAELSSQQLPQTISDSSSSHARSSTMTTPDPQGAASTPSSLAQQSVPIPAPLWVNLGLGGVSLFLAILWLIVDPGFEPLLALVGAASLGAGAVAFRRHTQWLYAAGIASVILTGSLLYVLLGNRPVATAATDVVIRVVDQNGRGVGVATVMLLSGQGIQRDVTDSVGVVQLREVPVVPNSQLVVEAPGYQPYNEALDFSQDAPRNVVLSRIDADRRSILVRVIEAGQFAPIANAQVVLVIGSTPYNARTDDNGLAAFELSFSEPSLLADITVTADGRQVSNQNLTLLPERLQDIRVNAASQSLEVITP